MLFVPRSKILPRYLWRPALTLFAIAQVLLALAPLGDARIASDASPHVEEAGTSLHHAHNEADCVACTAREILSSSEPASHEGYDADAASKSAYLPRSGAATLALLSVIHSRAPPASA
jgi:hypothetical protein